MPDETEDLFDSSGESQGYISIEQAGVLANQHAQNNTGSYDTPRLPRLGNRRSGGNRRLLRDKAFFPAHQKLPGPTGNRKVHDRQDRQSRTSLDYQGGCKGTRQRREQRVCPSGSKALLDFSFPVADRWWHHCQFSRRPAYILGIPEFHRRRRRPR